MALPALVLVHGGGLAADSWELTVNEIRRSDTGVDRAGRRLTRSLRLSPVTCSR